MPNARVIGNRERTSKSGGFRASWFGPLDKAAAAGASSHKRAILSALFVFACFTASSAGYLGWLYNLMRIGPPGSADASALGIGYLCQGAGIAAASLVVRRRATYNLPIIVGTILLQFACAIPAALGEDLSSSVALGCIMNVLCGIIAAFYLRCLTACVNRSRLGVAFGASYACSVIATWLFTLGPAFPIANAPNQLVQCAGFSLLAIALAVSLRFATPPQFDSKPAAAIPEPLSLRPQSGLGETTPSPKRTGFINLEASTENANPPDGSQAARERAFAPRMVLLAASVVLLMSTVKGLGFNFPSADIGGIVNLELSRLLYAVGLVAAGFAFDRSRNLGAILCLGALIAPFALMLLSYEPVPSAVLWAIDYLVYGFFSVFRVLLFADMAGSTAQPELSGFGLMFGRFGDALGAGIFLALGTNAVALIGTAGFLFVATTLAFVRLYQRILQAQLSCDGAAELANAKQDAFNTFAEEHGLSPRERDVLDLLLQKRTNPEIADELVVSENTVKFHVRNVLKKTRCKNRMELQEKFNRDLSDDYR